MWEAESRLKGEDMNETPKMEKGKEEAEKGGGREGPHLDLVDLLGPPLHLPRVAGLLCWAESPHLPPRKQSLTERRGCSCQG